ncbi:hypothetical protein [Streptomyces tubercidicus]|uniref:hypothetical protein n=1 Tax=Streptomyces tubercidicus TaxID=47759 RepID=UPI002E0DD821|nr:hypothetical protein OG761_23315 [Streptomyces tubercidicus]
MRALARHGIRHPIARALLAAAAGAAAGAYAAGHQVRDVHTARRSPVLGQFERRVATAASPTISEYP